MVEYIILILVIWIASLSFYREFRKWNRIRKGKQLTHPVFGNIPFGLNLYEEDNGFIVTNIDRAWGEHERMMIVLEPAEAFYERNQRLEQIAKLKLVKKG